MPCCSCPHFSFFFPLCFFSLDELLLHIDFALKFTSEPLRASTRVSSGFTLFRHSSPSFGSQQICSYSNLSQKILVGRWCTPEGIPPVHFHFASKVCHLTTRIRVRLLGPCFKTGWLKPLCQHLKNAGPALHYIKPLTSREHRSVHHRW